MLLAGLALCLAPQVSPASAQPLDRTPRRSELGAAFTLPYEALGLFPGPGRGILATVTERSTGDQNGDGDELDLILLFHSPTLGVTDLLPYGLDSAHSTLPPVVLGTRAFFLVSEAGQGQDLNGDGDQGDRVLQSHDLVSGESYASGLAFPGPRSLVAVGSDRLLLMVRESDQGQDLNGDGDLSDLLPHLYDPRSSQPPQSLGLVASNAVASERFVFLRVDEGQHGDLNADGDSLDRVLHVYDVESDTFQNLGLAIEAGLAAAEGRLAFRVDELEQGLVDLNDDGDFVDEVLHLWEPGTGVTNFRAAIRRAGPSLEPDFLLVGDRLAYIVEEAGQGELDLNGDGDALDGFLYLRDLETLATQGLGACSTLKLGQELLAWEITESSASIDYDSDGALESRALFFHHIESATTQHFVGSGARLFGARFEGELAALVGLEFVFGDLNGDGDFGDSVPFFYDGVRGTLTRLPYALQFYFEPYVGLQRGRAVFYVSESDQGSTDLDGDGTTGGVVLKAFGSRSGRAVDLDMSVQAFQAPGGPRLGPPLFHGGLAYASVDEGSTGHDFNGDGDLDDRVIRALRLQL